MTTRVFAPAKINLTLQVGRPRADGMHPLQSVVAFASVGDWIEAEPDTGSSVLFYIRGPFAKALHESAENIVHDAIGALQKTSRVERGGRITLDKQLPIASGIGGGSSDAAAALRALNALWNCQFSELQLAEIARPLGSDVPACVAASACFMTGTGADITPMTLPALDAVLVNPRLPLATASVYREFDRMGLGDGFTTATLPRWPDRSAAIEAVTRIGNDLTAPARALMPAIAVMMDALKADKRALAVSLSGSGATVFALVEDGGNARSLASDLGKRHPDWWIAPARLA